MGRNLLVGKEVCTAIVIAKIRFMVVPCSLFPAAWTLVAQHRNKMKKGHFCRGFETNFALSKKMPVL
jgi:hypothetical protein